MQLWAHARAAFAATPALLGSESDGPGRLPVLGGPVSGVFELELELERSFRKKDTATLSDPESRPGGHRDGGGSDR